MHNTYFIFWNFLICTIKTQGAEDELKHAVAMVQPVSVAFQVVTSFRFYKSGVYTSDTCGSTSMVSFFFITIMFVLGVREVCLGGKKIFVDDLFL